ncbi:hypothetical protein SKDZ_13G1710 [Saccharomyces kudriavzevii ZP591]|nr:hypothetical protein SKDZ_13G1710 [Saccharomyces kudriavzevii ZP591]
MSYYNRYRNKRRGDNGGGNLNSSANGSNGGMPSGLSASDAIFDLGKNKRVTVRQFRNINLIDIREYYLDSSTGEMKPGKKGISLTEDLYDELLKHRLNIDEALRRLGSKRPKTKMVRLLSDDEYEDDNNNDNNNDKDKNDKTNVKRRREDKSKSSNENHDMEPRSKKKRPAPPTLLPHEENIQNAEREANATLIIPGQAGRKQQEERKQKEKEEGETKARAVAEEEATARAAAEEEEEAKAKAKAVAEEKARAKESVPEPEPAPVLASNKEDVASNIDEAKDANSSDEEFAQSLEAEMNKAEDDISEEE